jgi:uncharacterized membrane-anchored protein
MNYPTVRSTMLRKVPEVTAMFWVAKLLTTALGESTSDWLVNKINPFAAVALGGVAFVIALAIQFRATKYKPWIYWLAAAMVAVFGTMAADGVHIQLGVPYLVSSIVFAVVLAAVFLAWQKTEGTLSIHTVTGGRREVFYWLTVVTTFALGTATGDLTANTFGLGYFWSGVLFIGIILIPALGYWFFGLGEIAAFWATYVITRPLGASFADWMGKSKSVSGLGWGDNVVALMLLILLACVVAYMSYDRDEIQQERRRIKR